MMPKSTNALTSNVVQAWHCDHFGHLNTRYYAAAFDDAIFVFWAQFDTPGAEQVVPVTAETKTTFKSEAPQGTVFSIYPHILRIGEKSVTLRLEMQDARSGNLLATCEVVEGEVIGLLEKGLGCTLA